MAAAKPYNRNASTLEDAPPKPTFAETVLFNKGFRFQSRLGEDKVDLRAISKVNIDRVIKEVDLEVLQNLVENLTFGELTEEDLDLYSNNVFVKLFQVSQLTLEHLLDVQDTLCANLNGLAKKYAAKKREAESLSLNLSRQDAQVATLRDELYHVKGSVVQQRMVSPTGVQETLNPAAFLSQEKRVESVLADDGTTNEGDVNVAESPKPAESIECKSTIKLNIVSSIHGRYLLLSVDSLITVKDLMKELVEKLASEDTSDSDFYCLIFKGTKLMDPRQTIRDAGIDSNNNALVLELYLPDAKCDDDSTKSAVLAVEASDAQALEGALATKIDELISTTQNSHKELTEASRTLQHQASLQDEHNKSILSFLELHLKGLEGAVRDEIQRGLHDAMSQFGRTLASSINTSDHVAPELEASAQLEIGEIESDDGELAKDHSAKDVKSIDVEPKPKRKVDLWIDTSLSEAKAAESPYLLESPLELDVVVDKSANDNSGNEDVVFQLPNAYSPKTDETKSPSEERSPTPAKEVPTVVGAGEADKSTKDEEPNLKPTLVSMPTPPSLKKLHGMDHHFRFSEYESEDCVSVDVVNQSYDSNNDFSKICGFTPTEITSGASEKGGVADLDLHSVEVSQSEFQVVTESTLKVEEAKDGDKSNSMSRNRTSKKFSFKGMLPKMMKSKGTRGLAGKKGERYGV
ncbi:hypothetical protein ACHAWO_012333 [Cyclotella atomus]|uniref:Cilium assembly protein DZIP1 N-terminal domain-containing protein n=1 Tax=Cyclotella atomus TaxID=382360 RepID=A0ABD3NFG8_9STRA